MTRKSSQPSSIYLFLSLSADSRSDKISIWANDFVFCSTCVWESQLLKDHLDWEIISLIEINRRKLMLVEAEGAVERRWNQKISMQAHES